MASGRCANCGIMADLANSDVCPDCLAIRETRIEAADELVRALEQQAVSEVMSLVKGVPNWEHWRRVERAFAEMQEESE